MYPSSEGTDVLNLPSLEKIAFFLLFFQSGIIRNKACVAIPPTFTRSANCELQITYLFGSFKLVSQAQAPDVTYATCATKV